MVNKERLINLFLDLVQIDSSPLEERKMADRLFAELLKLGAKVKEDDVAQKIKGQAGNLIAEFPGNPDFPVLLLSAHMDRVEPGQGIRPLLQNGYISSWGNTVLAGDDLLAVAAILEALKLIQEDQMEHGTIKVIFSVAEEIGLLGARYLDEQELQGVDYGLVFDLDEEIGTIVNQAPAQYKFQATIRGTSPAEINPSRGMALKIANLAISQMKLGQLGSKSKASIAIIREDRATELVELEGEIRGYDLEKLKEHLGNWRKLLRRTASKYQGEVEFKVQKLYGAFAISEEDKLIKLVKKAAEELQLQAKCSPGDGGSDANVFNEKGLTSVNLGIGVERVHSTKERVKVENLFKLAALIISIIKNSRDWGHV